MTKAQRRRENQKAAGALIQTFFGDVDSKGDNFISQLEKDHYGDFKYLYITRVDDVTFGGICLDEKGRSTYGVMIKYVNPAPFKAKPIVVEAKEGRDLKFSLLRQYQIKDIQEKLKNGTYVPEK